ncbi:eCIS core domain-containing protein [Phytohabitans sp. LJ34]|uniref:eCIS core domain-containing protein n=1 Tax=Phytohabitans sp. LJ34 TaxID=3452217 RepID=UPI003F896388
MRGGRAEHARDRPVDETPAPGPAAPPVSWVSNSAVARLVDRPGPLPVGTDRQAERATPPPPEASRQAAPPIVHTGGVADQAAAAVGALAFAFGPHVVLSSVVAGAAPPLRNRVLAHELRHVRAQTAAGYEWIERYEPMALNSSMTATAAESLPDEELRAELAAADAALSRPDLANRDTVRANRDLLETQAMARDLPRDTPTPGPRPYATAGMELTEDAQHVRYVLETLVTTRGTAYTERVVDDVDLMSTTFGKALYWMGQGASAGAYPMGGQPQIPPVFPSPALARLVSQQWQILKAENETIVRQAEQVGKALMLQALATSLAQTEQESQRYGWVSNRHYTLRDTRQDHLQEEQRLGRAAADLVAKRDRLLQVAGEIGALESRLNTAESDPMLAENLGARISALQAQQAQARADLLNAELAQTQQFPVLSAYVSRNEWDDLRDLAEDPTDWEYGVRIRETLGNILDVKEALLAGDTSIWKQDAIVGLLRQLQSIPPGSMRARLFDEAIAAADDDPWWKTALTVVGIGLSLLAAIPTGGQSLVVAAAILTADALAIGIDIYLLSEAWSEYQLDKAAAGSDLDIAKAVSSVEPSALWLAVQIVATGVGAAGTARTFRAAVASRAAARAATTSDELADALKALDQQLGDAGLPAAARERAISEAMPPGYTPDEMLRAAEEAGVRLSAESAAQAASRVYPGIRPELANRVSSAPLEGSPVGTTGKAWTHRAVKADEIKPIEDAVDGPGWQFPELKEGEVLVFPSGYRVWRDPGSKAIVEEMAVSESVTASRAVSQGEDSIHGATDMGPEFAAAKTERAHGAGSPGLGFDAPYGVVHAPFLVNQRYEKSLEAWLPKLQANAAPGVQYVYTTMTVKRGMALQERVYRVSAIADGEMHDLVEFTVRMDPAKGVGDAAVQVPTGPDVIASQEVLDRFITVDPGATLGEALGRQVRAKGATLHKGLLETRKRLKTLKETVRDKLEPRLVEGDVAFADALDELTATVGRLEDHFAAEAVDTAALTRVDEILTAFRARTSRRLHRVTAQDLQALTESLEDALR